MDRLVTTLIIQELRMDIGDVFQSLGDHLLDDDTKIDVEYIQCLKSLELHTCRNKFLKGRVRHQY
uniref:Uncharacterized protein n=1 Tax=Arion vulgaris TaxID=1028688 RepID=A0A0B7B818_9EUPU